MTSQDWQSADAQNGVSAGPDRHQQFKGYWPALRYWFKPRKPQRTYIRPAVFKTPFYY